MEFKIINKNSFQKRKFEILSLSNRKDKSIEEAILLNEIVISYTSDSIEKWGSDFQVKIGKSDKRRFKEGIFRDYM